MSSVLEDGIAEESKEGTDVSYYQVTGSSSDRWYTSPITCIVLGVTASATNTLIAIPIIFPKSVFLDRIAVNVTTAVGSSTGIRMGIYNDNGNSFPGSLLLDAGEVSASTTGVKSITISIGISPGIYWLCFLSEGAPSLRGASVASLRNILGNTSSLVASSAIVGVYKTMSSYGSLPSSFPTDTLDITSSTPLVFVRRSS